MEVNGTCTCPADDLDELSTASGDDAKRRAMTIFLRLRRQMSGMAMPFGSASQKLRRLRLYIKRR